MEEPIKYYRVTNTSNQPVYHDWTEDLLDEKQYKEWQEYKAHEMDGRSDEEKRILKNTPIAVRLQKWATLRGYGWDRIQEELKAGKMLQVPANYEPRRMFRLDVGETILSEKQKNHFKSMFRRPIEQKIKYGQIEPSIHYEGFITVEDATDRDVVKVLEEKKPFNYRCEKCGKSFQQENHLKLHMKAHDN